MKKEYTKEEKAAYFANLRAQWQQSKSLAQTNEIQAAFREAGLSISPVGFALVWRQMRALGYDGTPYVDCKTFVGWKDSGFKVRKGEHSQITGLTWISAGQKDNEETEEDISFKFPKAYHLFHRSQVDAL